MKSICKISFLLFIAFIFVGCENKKTSRPNVIIVMTDDQGYGDLGYHGNEIIKTPNIDDFASDAINFTNYHVGTTCSPTRAGFLTARNALRNGVWHTNSGCSLLHQDEITIGDVFLENGYRTGMFGKWHLGDYYSFLPEHRGFQETFYHKGGGVGQTPDYWLNDYQDDTYFRNGLAEKAKGYCTDVFFSEAIDFIEKNKNENFLCFLSLNAPHSPFNVPVEYYNLYKNQKNLLESQKRFYGMITNIDDNFGKLIQKLKKLNIYDNTIIIFTTDNGTSNGYKYDKKEKKWYGYNSGMRGTKTSEYDGGHRVPLIMRWKNSGYNGGKLYGGLSGHVDILPTIAKLTEINFVPKNKLDGLDISRLILTNKNMDRMLVTDTQRNQWPVKWKKTSVMYGNWRLVNGDELYNIENDIGQRNNLIKSNPEIFSKMSTFYNNWWDDVSKEFKYVAIDIHPDKLNSLTSHDIHVESTPAWDQSDVRKGNLYETGNFVLNFLKSGNYEIILRRWPYESGLHLNDSINTFIPSTKNWDELSYGKKLEIESAHLILDGVKSQIDITNNNKEAKIQIYIESGIKDLETVFKLRGGEITTPFYVEIKYL